MYRNIHINDSIWQYSVGVHGVKIRASSGKTYWIKNYVILGKSLKEYKKDLHKAYQEHDMDNGIGYAITPSVVKSYIATNLMEKSV